MITKYPFIFLFLLGYILFTSFKISAQEVSSPQISIGSIYYFIGTCSVKQCNNEGKADNAVYGNADISVPIGSIFKIVHVSTNKNSYAIQFLNWKPSATEQGEIDKGKLSKASPAILTSLDASHLSNDEKVYRFNYFTTAVGLIQQRYFLISSSNLSTYAVQKPAYFSPVGGAATLPFKYRPQSSGTFDKSLSIAGLAGLKHTWRNPNWSASYLVGIGLSSIAMDSTNNSSKNSSADISAISLSVGAVVQYKTLQLGIFIGEDHISNNKYYGWKYQGNLWAGIGIGFSIFSETQPATKNKNSQ
jgi:hypothetical protein